MTTPGTDVNSLANLFRSWSISCCMHKGLLLPHITTQALKGRAERIMLSTLLCPMCVRAKLLEKCEQVCVKIPQKYRFPGLLLTCFPLSSAAGWLPTLWMHEKPTVATSLAASLDTERCYLFIYIPSDCCPMCDGWIMRVNITHCFLYCDVKKQLIA